MAGRSVTVEFLGIDRSLSRTAKGATKSTTRLATAAKAAGRALATGLVVGTGAAALGLAKVTKGALEDEAAQKRLEAALKRTTGATNAQVAEVERWIAAQGRSLGVTDDELRPALEKLTAATGSITEAQRLAALAMDVSAARGVSLETVTKALERAQNGTASSLSRLGIETKNAAGETVSFEEATRRLADKFGGAAQKNAGTLAGKLQRLKVIGSEAGEAVGSKLLGPLTTAADWILRTGIPSFGNLADRATELFETSGAKGMLVRTFEALRDVAGKIKSRIGDAARAVADFVEDVRTLNAEELGRKVGSALADGIARLTELTGKIGAALAQVDWVGLGIQAGKYAIPLAVGLATGLINGITDPDVWRQIGAHWQELAVAAIAVAFAPTKLAGPISKALGKIPFVGKFAAKLFDWLNDLGAPIRGFAGRLGSRFLGAFREALTVPGGLVNRIASGISSIGSRAVDGLLKYASRFESAAFEWVERMGKGAGKAVGGVLSFFVKLPLRIVSALGSLGTRLFSSGVALISGFISGIRAMAGSVLSAIKDSITDKIPQFVKDKLGINSPSKVFIEIGKSVGEGMAEGIRRSSRMVGSATSSLLKETNAKARDVANGLAKDIAKVVAAATKKLGEIDMSPDIKRRKNESAEDFRDRRAEAIKKAQKEGRDALRALADKVGAAGEKALEKVNGLLSDASDRLKSLKDEAASFANGFRSFTSSVFGFKADGDTPYTYDGLKKIGSTLAGLLGFQKDQQAKAEQLAADVQALMGAGLSEELLRQLQAEGANGIDNIRALAEGLKEPGGRDLIAQLNASNAATLKALDGIGQKAADSLYGAAIADTQATVDRLVEVRDAIKESVHGFVEGVKDALRGEGFSLGDMSAALGPLLDETKGMRKDIRDDLKELAKAIANIKIEVPGGGQGSGGGGGNGGGGSGGGGGNGGGGNGGGSGGGGNGSGGGKGGGGKGGGNDDGKGGKGGGKDDPKGGGKDDPKGGGKDDPKGGKGGGKGGGDADWGPQPGGGDKGGSPSPGGEVNNPKGGSHGPPKDDPKKKSGKGARGGIVTEATRALIGERGPEAVIPLDRMPGAIPLPSRGTGGTVTNIYITVQGDTDPDAAARRIQQKLLRLKRVNGGTSLGLA